MIGRKSRNASVGCRLPKLFKFDSGALHIGLAVFPKKRTSITEGTSALSILFPSFRPHPVVFGLMFQFHQAQFFEQGWHIHAKAATEALF